MKNKRTPIVKKHKRILKYGIVTAIILISSILIFILLFPFSSPYHPNPNTFYFNAAIVDHLSLSSPNQTFAETATTILKNGGFAVDYYPGETVKVDLYRNLPKHNYGIIILRVHSAVGTNNDPPLALFTSEHTDKNKYVIEQLNDQLQGVAFLPYKQGDPTYFGIPPKFVRECMNGGFQNTIIIAMGCDSLKYTDMAEAFLYKGAKAYIGWSASVIASHTDNVIQQLLKYLITERKTIGIATSLISPDPSTNSHLIFYPQETKDSIIPEKSPTNNFPSNNIDSHVQSLKSELISSNSNSSVSRTPRIKLNSFLRTFSDKLGYHTGDATTKPRHA
jgi:hypothetical protein